MNRKKSNKLSKEDVSLISEKIPSGLYQHYKGKHYLVLGVATHSETLEKFVVYVHLHEGEGTALWIRPFNMFFEEVEVDGIKKPRFRYIGNEFPAD